MVYALYATRSPLGDVSASAAAAAACDTASAASRAAAGAAVAAAWGDGSAGLRPARWLRCALPSASSPFSARSRAFLAVGPSAAPPLLGSLLATSRGESDLAPPCVQVTATLFAAAARS